MAITDTARAKARAAVSKAEARVAEVQAELTRTRTELEGTDSAGELLESVSDVAVVGSLTSGMRGQVVVDRAKLQAELDQLTADLSEANDKLDIARKAEAVVLAVVGPDED
jgi:hypothetical protein